MRLCLITHEFNVVDHLFNITLVELLCKDRESRMYFVSMGKGGDGREEV